METSAKPGDANKGRAAAISASRVSAARSACVRRFSCIEPTVTCIPHLAGGSGPPRPNRSSEDPKLADHFEGRRIPFGPHSQILPDAPLSHPPHERQGIGSDLGGDIRAAADAQRSRAQPVEAQLEGLSYRVKKARI